MRQPQLLEEVGRDFRQVVVREIQDLSVAVDDARYRRQRRIHTFDGLTIKRKKFASLLSVILQWVSVNGITDNIISQLME
jgi:hypothetical protein